METNTFDAVFAHKLYCMIDASLISYKFYEPWCDHVIEHADKAPLWIMDLTCTRVRTEAVHIIGSYIFSESAISTYNWTDFYIACLYCKYEKRISSWADFLLQAGDYSDGSDCLVDCSYFYLFLNELEDSEYSYIQEVHSLYAYFRSFFVKVS